jgi:3-deoxy-D-manno-octulosonic-acid transferase
VPLLFDALYLLALVAAAPWLLARSLSTGKYRRGWAERLFGTGACPTSSQPVAWFHGVSLGEVHVLRTLVPAFRRRHPDWQCVVTAGTDTGLDEARRCFPDLPVLRRSLDLSGPVRRQFGCIRPALVVLTEGDLWPNFLREAGRRGVPVVVVNTRFSPRSAARYRRLRWLAGALLRRVSLFCVQSEEYADQLRRLGVPAERIALTGSIKFDGASGDRANPRTQELRRLLNVTDGDLVLVAGSTQAPEEAVALDIYRREQALHPRCRLIIVPRHPERFEEVAWLLRESGVPFVRRSELHGPLADRSAVVLADTMGELSALWGLADVAFVGGSLDGKRGGQNLIEPAAYGCAVVVGPHTWNFRDPVARLTAAGGAVQVADAAELGRVVGRLLADGEERRRVGESARQLVRSQQGATGRTVEMLEGHLQTGRSLHPAA